MTRTMLSVAAIAALVAAVTASAVTLIAVNFMQPDTVQAAPQRRPGMQVATVNLEQVARVSKTFANCKVDWERAQSELATQNRETREAYLQCKRDLDAALSSDEEQNPDQIIDLRVQLQSYEESINAAKVEQRQYLSALLDEYQKRVLKEVIADVRTYARHVGFDLVLQTYSTGGDGSDFFGGGDYAQSLMSQTVLDAPGADDLSNAHVTDITDNVVLFMRTGKLPENEKD